MIACMAWFRRRKGYSSCDYFSVTPVFQTESMLLLKFTCIFLKAPSWKQSFSIFTCRALGRNRTLMISCLCNVLFTGLGFAKCSRSWDILEKHTYIHTYIHTNKHDLSPFSIACWTPASRLRRSASVWTRSVSISIKFNNILKGFSSS